MKKSGSFILDHNLELLYIRTFHVIENAIKKELLKKGIQPMIGAMVGEIYRQKNPSPTDLARISRRKPQTITAMVVRMEKKGLVKRVTNEKRKNTCSICLTEKGLALYQKIMKIDVFTRSTETLTEEKRRCFQECLEEIAYQTKNLKMW